MKNFIFKFWLAISLIAMLISHSTSQVRNQMFIGARPLGLGETFVSIADDGNAAYWNPAGLPTMRRMELNSMYAKLYNIPGLSNAYLSFVYPITNRYVIGASYFHFGSGDDELEFFRDMANLSFGARIYKNIFLGGNLKYINTDARLDGFSEGKADGFGFDLGALYTLPLAPHQFLKQINFGLMAYDATGTSVTYAETRKSDEILPQNIRFGLTFFPQEKISLKWFSLSDALLAFDFDDRFHFGTEAWLFENLALRGGFQKDFHTSEGPTYSFGGSLKFPFISVQMDYAYLIPPTLSSTHVFSFSFIPSVSPIKITDMNVDDLFASFYKYYANNDIGKVEIRNDYDKELNMTLNVSIPGLTEIPTQENFVLGPNEKKSFDFKAILSKIILDVKESEYRQVKIKVDYQIRNEKKFVDATKKFQLYGRGAITWEDPRKAAAFITKLDQMVKLFAEEATSELPYRTETELGNIFTAAALFEAMGAIGIKYKEDPENPFSTISRSQHSVDFIQYPAELLKSKQGDCDDLTMLYASLLEYAGVKTMLISMAGHITLMFDTGIHERNWGLLPLGDSLVVVKDKSLWIPVEVTEVGKTYVTAWREGGKKYRAAEQDRDFQVVKVRDVEGIYLSALPDELQDQIPTLPPKEALNRLVAEDCQWIQNRRTKIAIDRHLAELKKKPEDSKLRNQLGIILAQQDSLKQAEEQFNQILLREPQNPQALNNLANVYTISAQFKQAEKAYLKAANVLKNEPGLSLNLAILYQLWKYESQADSARFQLESEKQLENAFRLLKSNEIAALDKLGISGEDLELPEKADVKDEVKQKLRAIQRFIKENTQKHLLNKPVKGARIERMAVKRGPDKDRSYILWWADSGF